MDSCYLLAWVSLKKLGKKLNFLDAGIVDSTLRQLGHPVVIQPSSAANGSPLPTPG